VCYVFTYLADRPSRAKGSGHYTSRYYIYIYSIVSYMFTHLGEAGPVERREEATRANLIEKKRVALSIYIYLYSTFVYVYIYMHIYTCVCLNICIYICKYICLSIYLSKSSEERGHANQPDRQEKSRAQHTYIYYICIHLYLYQYLHV